MSWGYIGKVPTEVDFVRHGAGDALASAAFRWIADAVSTHPGWVRSVPSTGIRFVYASPDVRERALVGVLVGSRDRVGREFPLVAFHPLVLGAQRPSFPAAPLAWNGALSAARRALGVPDAPPALAALPAALEAIAVPSAHDIARTFERSAAALERAPGREFHERLFADTDTAPHYAYHTLRTATAQLATGRAPALVCPVALQADVFAWLELVKRLSPPGAGLPGMVWSSGATARLVVGLSELPSAALPAAVAGDADSSRVWPLSTPSDAARLRARDLIHPLLPRTDATVMSMVRALSHRSPA